MRVRFFKCPYCNADALDLLTVETSSRACYDYRQIVQNTYYECVECQNVSLKSHAIMDRPIRVVPATAERARLSASSSSATAADLNNE